MPRMNRIGAGLSLVAFAGGALVAGRSAAVPGPTSCPSEGSGKLVIVTPGQAMAGQPILLSAQGSIVDEGFYVKNEGCVFAPTAATTGRFEIVSGPAGNHATLTPAGTLMQRFVGDRDGDYVVRFTACPTRCARSGSADVTIHVGGVFRPRPDTEPMEYAEASPHPPSPSWPWASAICDTSSPGSLILRLAPEWAAMSYWPNGAVPPYRLVEGLVREASVSRVDNFSAHDSQDTDAVLALDPEYRSLRSGDQDELEIEWENPRWPDPFRPVPGDRVSALGYHVLDCGHPPYRAEIHPPIATAVHRPLAIPLLPDTALIPANGGAPVMTHIGTNVWVAGIQTSVWVDRNKSGLLCGGGACMANRVRTEKRAVIVNGQPKEESYQVTDYVNAPSPVKGSHGENPTTFTFKIHLPASPSEVSKRYGHAPPAVGAPLYVRILPTTSQYGMTLPARLTGNRRLDGPEPFIEVAVDLASMGDHLTGAVTIQTAWVFPDVGRDGSEPNWGLRSYRLKLQEFKVADDGDPITDGDWRYWFLFPHATRSWVRLIDFDCDGCVAEKPYSASNGPWMKRTLDPDGTVISDQLAFPWQLLSFQSTGFEDDTISSDGVESIGATHATSDLGRPDHLDGTGCTPMGFMHFVSGCTAYSAITSFVQGGEAIGTSNVGLDLKKIALGFWLSGAPRPGTEALAPVSAFRMMARTRRAPSPPPVPPSTAAAVANITAMHAREPARVDFALVRMRARLQQALAEAKTPASKQKILAELAKLKPYLPADLYKKHLCDLEPGASCR